MNINITLFVQMLNFLIAYAIITRFFLKPIFSSLEQDERGKKILLDQITLESKKLAAQHIVKEEKWLDCQQEFKNSKPDLDTLQAKQKRAIQAIQVPEKLTENKINALVSNIVLVLKSKVSH